MKILIVHRSRPKPRIGDRRLTKRHGLQIRVIQTSDGMWVKAGGRYCFEWRSLSSLIADPLWHHVVPLPKI